MLKFFLSEVYNYKINCPSLNESNSAFSKHIRYHILYLNAKLLTRVLSLQRMSLNFSRAEDVNFLMKGPKYYCFATNTFSNTSTSIHNVTTSCI